MVDGTSDDDFDDLDEPVPAERSRRARITRATLITMAPFGLVVLAIAVLTSSALLWVTSPQWGGGDEPGTQRRNVGVVPVTPGAVAAATIAPVRIEIPALKAVAPIINVEVLPGRELDVPQDPMVVGWWKGGARPGARTGTAILDGHINYKGQSGVLGKIGTLNPGDDVYVYGFGPNGKNKKTAFRLHFVITGVRTYNKQALPYAEIFDQKSVGRLAIVTCGGPFDASTGNYLDNIVAFAVPA